MKNRVIFKKISIIGLGFMGGSLAKTLKKKYNNCFIEAYDINEQSLLIAKQENIINEFFDSPECSVIDSDLIILCCPLGQYRNICNKISPFLKNEAIIIDIGSIKQSAISSANYGFDIKKRNFFIPCHPIAGSQNSGFLNSEENLFENKRVFITPTQNTDTQALNKIINLWQNLGSIVEIMHPAEHDKIFATLSHLPQILAFCYANFALEDNLDKLSLQELSGINHFIEFLRIGASSPKIWADIFIANKNCLINTINDYISLLEEYKLLLINDNFINKLDNILKQRLKLDEIHDKTNDESIPQNSSVINNYLIPIIIGAACIENATNISYCGRGFLDFTAMVKNINIPFYQIVQINNKPLHKALTKFIEQLEQIKELVANANIAKLEELLLICQNKNKQIIKIN